MSTSWAPYAGRQHGNLYSTCLAAMLQFLVMCHCRPLGMSTAIPTAKNPNLPKTPETYSPGQAGRTEPGGPVFSSKLGTSSSSWRGGAAVATLQAACGPSAKPFCRTPCCSHGAASSKRGKPCWHDCLVPCASCWQYHLRAMRTQQAHSGTQC